MREAQAAVIRLLGPVQVISPDMRERLRPGRQQALLARLALQPNTTISTTALVNDIWGDNAPNTAVAMAHNYIAQSRALLDGIATIRTTGQGYRLDIEPTIIDAHLARRLREDATNADSAGDRRQAISLLERAVALWHGPSLDNLDAPFVAVARADLDALRATLLLDLVRQHLADGPLPAALLEDLTSSVRDDPLDERAQSLLIHALHAAGRRSDALAQYDSARRALAEQLGVIPGAMLREAHALLLEPRPPTPARQTDASARPQRRRRVRVGGILVVAAIVAAVALAVAFAGAPHRSGRTAATSVSSTATATTGSYPSAPVIATFDLAQPSCCAVTAHDVWGAGHHDNTLHEWSLTSHRPVQTFPVIGFQAGVPVAAAGSIWVPSPGGPLTRFDEATRRVMAQIPVSGAQVTFGFQRMWATTRDHTLVAISLQSNKVVLRSSYGQGENDWDDSLVTGPGAVWVADADAGELLRFDPSTGRLVARIGGFGATDSSMPISYGEGAVWVKRYVGDREVLFRIDPRLNAISGSVATTLSPPVGLTGAIAVGDGYVWTGNSDMTLSEIDPRRLRIVRQLALPGPAQSVVFAGGFLWIDSYDDNVAWQIRVS